MQRIGFLCIAVSAIAMFPALAQDAGPSVPSVPDRMSLQLSTEACLIAQDDRVPSADYAPGIDSRGRPVAGADVEPSVFSLPDVIDVPITVSVARRLGIDPDRFDGDLPVATLSLRGRDLYLNDRRITPDEVYVVSDLCRRALP